MKFLKTIIISIALALATSKIKRKGTTCHGHEGCKSNEFCGRMIAHENYKSGLCEPKRDANGSCSINEACKSGKCDTNSKKCI